MEDNITKHVNNILLKSTELLRNLELKIDLTPSYRSSL
jgi:hypothetical protein